MGYFKKMGELFMAARSDVFVLLHVWCLGISQAGNDAMRGGLFVKRCVEVNSI